MPSVSRPRRKTAPPIADAKLASRRTDQGVARYYRLYELLSAALQDGTLAPESLLPSEPALCARHGISRTTVRRALDRLEREGSIVRKRGLGTYARPQKAHPRLCLELHRLPETLAALASRTPAATLRLEPAPVPAPLRAMAPEIGSAAYLLKRLRGSKGEPVSVTSTYLREPVGRRLRQPIPQRSSLIGILERLEVLTGAVRCTVGVVPADADAAQALQVPLGTPLLRIRAVLKDHAGAPQAVLESFCRSDRLQLKLLEPSPGAPS